MGMGTVKEEIKNSAREVGKDSSGDERECRWDSKEL